jgi:large subunit ribosomal protein L25
MPEIVVAAESRTETGKNANRRLRAAGKIPGVLYGTGKKPTAVAVSPKDIGSILKSDAGENTLFELEIGGTRRKVILKEFQIEPIKSRLLHADFYEVALDKAIEVKVHIELRGVPVGVKVEGGILDFVTRELEISCLPTDIPAKIEVDVSHLELGKHLRVSDLKIPEKVVVLTGADVVVAHVVAPRAEEEAAPAVEVVAGAEGAGTEPEVIKKGKAEEEGEGEKGEKGEKPSKPAKAEKKEKK